MKQKEITFCGKTYTVVFTIKTIMGYEQITGRSFFDAGNKLSTIGDKAALLYAAIVAADEKADIAFDDIINSDRVAAVNEIVSAFAEIDKLAEEFFEIPKVEPQPEPAAEDQKGDQPKN